MRVRAAEPRSERTAKMPSEINELMILDWVFMMPFRLIRLLARTLIYVVKRSWEDHAVGMVYIMAATPVYYLIADAYIGLGPYAVAAWNWLFGNKFQLPLLTAPFLPGLLPPRSILLAFLMIAPAPVFDLFWRWRAKRYAKKHPPPPPIESDPSKLVVGLECSRTWIPEENRYKTEQTRKFYTLDWEHLATGMLVVAPQGGGKTTFLRQIMQYNDRNGIAYLTVDYKGDEFDPGDFDYNFDLGDPESGGLLNITSGLSPRVVGQNLGEAAVPYLTAAQWYFTGTARNTTASLFVCHHAAYGDYPEIATVVSYLRSNEARSRLLLALKDAGFTQGTEESSDMDRIIDLATKRGQDAFGTLDVALAPFAWGAAGRLFTTRGGIGFDELLSKPNRIRLSLAFNEHNMIAPSVGRLVLSLFINSVLSGRISADLRRMIILDEAAPFVSKTLLEGMRLMRYHNGSVVMALQDTHAIEDVNLREQTITLSGTKIVMPGIGGLDSATLSELFGSSEHDYYNESDGVSKGNSVNASSAGLMASGGRRGRAGSVTETTGKTRAARVRANYLPSEIRYQEAHHAVVESRTATGTVRPPVLVNMHNDVVEPSIEIQNIRAFFLRSPRPQALPPLSRTSLPQATSLRGMAVPQLEEPERAELKADDEADTAYDEPWPADAHDEAQPPAEALKDATNPTSRRKSKPALRAVSKKPSGHRYLQARLAPAKESETAGGDTSDRKRDVPSESGADPAWVGEAALLICAGLPEIDHDAALRHARIAHTNGRDKDYIEKLLAYVIDNSEVRNPTGKFISSIKTNKAAGDNDGATERAK